jgi:hypothetical protein
VVESFYFHLRIEMKRSKAAGRILASAPPTYVLLTDAPPLKRGGHGCHVLTWNWIEAMGNRVRLVITHQLQSRLSCDQIRGDLSMPVWFYPDLCQWRVPGALAWLQALLERWLFLFWLVRHAAKIRAIGADRLFAFFGGNGWFLWIVQAAADRIGLPLDIYLVDDLEKSALLNGAPRLARQFGRQEAKVLPAAERVFTISPGYVEHLSAKYQVRSTWLPIVIPESNLIPHQYHSRRPDVRTITFLGAVNPLYLDGLRDLLRAIKRWNSQDPAYQLCLTILTYTDPSLVRQELGAGPDLEVVFRCDNEELHQRLRGSWALFLPYSFAPDLKLMVSTSFPHKIVESLGAGRPVLVYGPAYASLPRYFRDNDLPLCVTRTEDLWGALPDISKYDTSDLTRRYQRVIEKFHSPEKLRQLLDSHGAADVLG